MGYTLKTGIPTQGNSDANYRAFVQFISNAMEAGGIIKTADTGQINPVTATGAGGGYEIRRFSDDLQATAPVFIKIEYLYAASMYARFTIGTGSNGAGAITGVLLNAEPATSNSPLASAPSMISVGTARFTFAMNYMNGTPAQLHGLERTKNDDGTDSNVGLMYCRFGDFVGYAQHFLPFSGIKPAAETVGNILLPNGGTTVFGANVGIYPNPYFYFGENVNAGRNFYGYKSTEILQDSVVAAQVYGVNQSFLTFGVAINAMFPRTNNSPALLVRFD